MKTKIAALVFATALLFNLITDIGGTTLPPKGSSGSAFKTANPTRDVILNPEVIAIALH